MVGIMVHEVAFDLVFDFLRGVARYFALAVVDVADVHLLILVYGKLYGEGGVQYLYGGSFDLSV